MKKILSCVGGALVLVASTAAVAAQWKFTEGTFPYHIKLVNDKVDQAGIKVVCQIKAKGWVGLRKTLGTLDFGDVRAFLGSSRMLSTPVYYHSQNTDGYDVSCSASGDGSYNMGPGWLSTSYVPHSGSPLCLRVTANPLRITYAHGCKK